MTTVLGTERLILRELTPHDVDALLEVFSDPEAMEYFPSTKTAAETRAWIDMNRASYRERQFGLWAAILRETDEFVGQAGLVVQPDVDGEDEIEIGYTLARRFWGRGLATEAARACRDHGFGSLGLARLVSLIDPGNSASVRVAEKIGMHPEKDVDRWGRRLRVYAMTPADVG